LLGWAALGALVYGAVLIDRRHVEMGVEARAAQGGAFAPAASNAQPGAEPEAEYQRL
jgi:hypothetical protein